MVSLDALARRALEPLDDPWLEGLNQHSEPYRRLLYWLVLATRPRVVVELGVGEGLTTAHLASAAAAAGARVCAADDRLIDLGWLDAELPGVVTLLQCDSLGAAEAVRHEKGKIGLLFQDSSHHGEHSRQEWLYWRPLLAPGAAWVCDDISPAFRMRDEPFGMMDYWHWIPEGEKRLLPGMHGLGVVLLP